MSTATKIALKTFLQSGHRLLQKQSTQSLLSTLHAHPLHLHYHRTPSVLSSASLLCSYLKNWCTRNRESIGSGTIKRIMALADYKHPIWRYRLNQRPRQLQYSQVAQYLKMELQKLQVLEAFKPEDVVIKERIRVIGENLRRVQLSVDLMKEEVIGSLHPEAGTSASTSTSANGIGTSTGVSTSLSSSTPSSQFTLSSSQPSTQPLPTLRGFLISLAGPRKGNRAMTWQRSIGATSTNSVNYVIAEESKCQLPSKMGTFGLTVRMVYGRVRERPLGEEKRFDGINFY